MDLQADNGLIPVSYTHLDVYKRQTLHCEYTDPLALHAIEMINEYLIPSRCV